MFNVSRNAVVPGFRVGLTDDDQPGFNVAGDDPTTPVPPGDTRVPAVDDNYPFGTTSLRFISPQRLSPNPAAPFGYGPPPSPPDDQTPPDSTERAGSLPPDPGGYGSSAFDFARYIPGVPIEQPDPMAQPPNPVQKTSGGDDSSSVGSAQAQTPQAQRPGTSLQKDPSPGEAVALPDGSTVPDPKSPTGKLMAPMADLSAVAAAGRQVGSTYRAMLSSPEGAAGAFPYLGTQLLLNVAHWGKFDYQRRGNMITGGIHLPQFAHVSNFNVGLFGQQAGLTLDETLRIAGTYACLRSDNADPSMPHCLNAEQFEYITGGYKAGQSGMFGQSDDTL
jgi:hypothetical protein